MLRRVRAALRGRRRRLFRGVVAEKDRAVLVLALADARAELHEVLVRVDDRALHGLRGTDVVTAVVERHPAPSVLFALSNFWPRHAATHGRPHRYNAPLGSVKVTGVVSELHLNRWAALPRLT